MYSNYLHTQTPIYHSNTMHTTVTLPTRQYLHSIQFGNRFRETVEWINRNLTLQIITEV